MKRSDFNSDEDEIHGDEIAHKVNTHGPLLQAAKNICEVKVDDAESERLWKELMAAITAAEGPSW
jgi:hypothetical protein